MKSLIVVAAAMLAAVPAYAQGRANENTEADPYVVEQRIMADCIAAPSPACAARMGYFAGLRIEDPFVRATTLAEVAEAQSRAKDTDAARETLDAALDAVDALLGGSGRGELLAVKALGAIADAQEAAGDEAGASASAERALELSLAIGNDAIRSQALSVIAENQAKIGDVAGALETIDAAIAASSGADARAAQDRALNAIAEAQTKIDDVDGALETAKRIRSERVRNKALVRVVEVKANSKEFDDARRLADSIDDLAARIRGYHNIAYAQFKRGKDFEAARATIADGLAAVSDVPRTGELAWALRDLSKDQGETGDIAGALETAQTLDDFLARDRATRDAVETFGETGDYESAIEHVDLIEQTTSRVHALRVIAEAQEIDGNDAEAQKYANLAFDAAETVDDPFERAVALSGLAESFTIVGDMSGANRAFDAAFAAAGDITSMRDQSRALSFIAESQAVAGDVAGAFNTVQSIAVPAVRTRAYIHLSHSKALGAVKRKKV